MKRKGSRPAASYPWASGLVVWVATGAITDRGRSSNPVASCRPAREGSATAADRWWEWQPVLRENWRLIGVIRVRRRPTNHAILEVGGRRHDHGDRAARGPARTARARSGWRCTSTHCPVMMDAADHVINFKQSELLPNFSQKCSQVVQDKLMDIWSPQVDMADHRLKAYTKVFTYGLMGTISGWMSEDFSAPPETVTQDFVDFYNLKVENINK